MVVGMIGTGLTPLRACG